MLTGTSLQIALLQMDITIGQPEENFAALELLLEQAMKAEQKPDVIVLPEMWNTGYALDRIHELGDMRGERSKAMLSAFSREHGVHIIGGSVAEIDETEAIRNTTYTYDRSGTQTAAYSKLHLFRLMDEHKYLTPGEQAVTFELDDVKAGLMICYDIRFPELARKLALDGAQIMFVPAEWPNPRLHHWRTLLMARAIENQMYVVACNRVGVSGTTEFFGHSMIVDPWGEVLAEGGDEPQIVTARIDVDQVARVRSQIPVFADRRPAHY